VRIFSLENTRLLRQGKDLDAEVAAGTEKGRWTGEKSEGKCKPGPGFLTQVILSTPDLTG
jgi:hypothetical protein